MEDVLKLPRAVFKHRNSGLYYYNRGYTFGNIQIFIRIKMKAWAFIYSYLVLVVENLNII